MPNNSNRSNNNNRSNYPPLTKRRQPQPVGNAFKLMTESKQSAKARERKHLPKQRRNGSRPHSANNNNRHKQHHSPAPRPTQERKETWSSTPLPNPTSPPPSPNYML